MINTWSTGDVGRWLGILELWRGLQAKSKKWRIQIKTTKTKNTAKPNAKKHITNKGKRKQVEQQKTKKQTKQLQNSRLILFVCFYVYLFLCCCCLLCFLLFSLFRDVCFFSFVHVCLFPQGFAFLRSWSPGLCFCFCFIF